MIMSIERLLTGIGYTEPSTFNEICNALDDHIPDRGDKAEWRDFFKLLEKAQRDGFCRIDYIKGRIDQVQLTDEGQHVAKQFLATHS